MKLKDFYNYQPILIPKKNLPQKKKVRIPPPPPKPKKKQVKYICTKCSINRKCWPEDLPKCEQEGCKKCRTSIKSRKKKAAKKRAENKENDRMMTDFKHEVSRGRYNVSTHTN